MLHRGSRSYLSSSYTVPDDERLQVWHAGWKEEVRLARDGREATEKTPKEEQC